MIDLNNWNYCFYASGNLKAYITFGADWNEKNQETAELFWVSIGEGDEGKVHFQREFNSLDTAITQINDLYGHWDFSDPLKSKSSEGGCGSCQAH